MKSAVREIGVSDRLVRRMAKEKLKLKAYKLQKVQRPTNAYGCKDTASSSVGSLFSNGSVCSLPTRSCSPSSKPPNPFHRGCQYLNRRQTTSKSRSGDDLGAEPAAAVRSPLDFVEQGENQPKKSTAATFSRPLCFLRLNSISWVQFGRWTVHMAKMTQNWSRLHLVGGMAVLLAGLQSVWSILEALKPLRRTCDPSLKVSSFTAGGGNLETG